MTMNSIDLPQFTLYYSVNGSYHLVHLVLIVNYIVFVWVLDTYCFGKKSLFRIEQWIKH